MHVNETLWRDACPYTGVDGEALLRGANLILWGGRCQHSLQELCVIERLLSFSQPARIVEIGTGEGRHTLYLALWAFLHEAAKVLSIDVADRVAPQIHEAFHRLGVTFVRGDCFEPSILAYMDDFTRQGRALIYCDGGCKSQELRTFVRLIKPGDVIACHDFGEEVPQDEFGESWCQANALTTLWPEVFSVYGCRQAAWLKMEPGRGG